jgi:hypothetical protein
MVDICPDNGRNLTREISQSHDKRPLLTSIISGQILGWTGLVRVDNETFTWMGAPINIPSANQTAYECTSTRSIFTIEVDDKVILKATFLSPLTPNDLKRQSLVFFYMNVEVSSLDGSNHDVQIYTDVSAGKYTTAPDPYPIR